MKSKKASRASAPATQQAKPASPEPAPQPRRAKSAPPSAERRPTTPPEPQGPPPPEVLGKGAWHDAAGPAPRTWSTRWLVLGSILLAWCFGFGVRAAWVAKYDTTPQTKYEEKRLLSTADAYFYASGVQHEVQGTLDANPRVPTTGDSIVVALGAGVVHLFGVSIEDLGLWMPAVLAPLIAVSLVLLGLLFGQIAWGVFASLVAVLGFSYWNRTVPGYFDTDMVSIPYCFGIAALLIAAFWRKRTVFGAAAALLTVVAPYIHPGSERVLAAVTIGALGYAALFTRKEPHAWRVGLAMLIAFLPLPTWARMLLIAALELGLPRLPAPVWSLAAATALMFVAVVLTSTAMDLVLATIGIHRGGGGGGGLVPGVELRGVADTVAELAAPGLDRLAGRVAGSTVLLVLGIIGYFLACWRFRPLLLLGPFLALGTVLAASGQRYTIFAVPVVALGDAWLALMIGRFAARFLPPRLRFDGVALAAPLVALAVVPAVEHALAYGSRTAMSTVEAQTLHKLAGKVKPGDFIISWWDYAYGAWYYAGANTIIDGTKQNEDVWIVAELLFTSSQREAAALARLAAEKQAHEPPLSPVIDDLLADFRAQSGKPSSDFIPALREGRVAIPPATRQVFLYIPWRFLQIAPNVATLRPAKGLMPEAELNQSTFLLVSPINGSANSGWSYDASQQVVVSTRGERVKVNKVADVDIKDGRLRTKITDAQADGLMCVVNLRHSGTRVILHRSIYESVLGQLLLLGRPDPAYFETVEYAQGGVVYRVR